MRPCFLLLGFCALQIFPQEGSAERDLAVETKWAEERNNIADKRPRQRSESRRSGERIRIRIKQDDGYLENWKQQTSDHAEELEARKNDTESNEGVSQSMARHKPSKEIVTPRSSPMQWSLKQWYAFIRIRREPEPSAESTAEPKPTSEPRPEKMPTTSEPEPSAESSPEPNPDPESTSEPEATSEPEPEPENSWPEPAPEWPSAYEKWQVAWPLHTYGFAATFCLIGVVQTVELIRIYCDRERKTPLKQSLMIMIIIFVTTRAIVLFASPYGSTGNLPPVATRLLSSIGQPCIIAAVSLLLLVLIDTTKMNVAPPRFQSVTFIVPVITLHVLLVVVSDVIVARFLQVKVLLLFCQLYFLITGLALTLGYARVGWKISQNVASNVNQIGHRSQDSKMNKLQRLIVAFTVTSAMLLAVTIYGAAGVFGIYSNVMYVEAWPWWGLQTAFRCLETTMCVLLLIMNINTSASRSSRCFPIFHKMNCLGRTQVHAWSRESTLENATLQNTVSLPST